MSYSTPEQLHFPPLSGYTVRANFDGGALSSDFGALLLRGIDRQIGLTERLAAAVRDKRHRRILTIRSGTSSPNVSTKLPPAMRTAMMRTARYDPMFKLRWNAYRSILPKTWRVLRPFPARTSGDPHGPLPRQAFVDHFIASYPEPRRDCLGPRSYGRPDPWPAGIYLL